MGTREGGGSENVGGTTKQRAKNRAGGRERRAETNTRGWGTADDCGSVEKIRIDGDDAYGWKTIETK